MENNKIITLEGVKKHFPIGGGKFTALNGITITFGEGEFAGFVGPSGSGKTTLLNLIGSLDTPSEGKVLVLDNDIGLLTAKRAALLRRKKLGFIFQTYNLLPVYTVYENVEFPLLLIRMPPAEREKRVHEALERVGLRDKSDSLPDQLSGGESQRVAIARALVKLPEIVLADEQGAGRHRLEGIIPKTDDFNSIFEVTLRTESYWTRINDPTMRSYKLLSAWQE